eukprot:Plantae.Rhodophyta-Hildenbrandia_rubra.ctg44751.p3 GENE.Plantae.Rhodophyta-Hildenbrandia_rubra.ctg44751~~Plantae.Rhodophyta-Hildenbrandia_rubra.ctg44751.p3  ORF type:complete len:125 (-),score=10.81 Plantae.Rhodophyta-Hildenbrandia_rubra.ctg44751:1029-1403(-)
MISTANVSPGALQTNRALFQAILAENHFKGRVTGVEDNIAAWGLNAQTLFTASAIPWRVSVVDPSRALWLKDREVAWLRELLEARPIKSVESLWLSNVARLLKESSVEGRIIWSQHLANRVLNV